ncbi:MAG: LuxR C-terminal-related transcriptional regulator [Anaerolineae bacterium]
MPKRKKKNSSAARPTFPRAVESGLDALVRVLTRQLARASADADKLTRREWQTIELIGRHHTDGQIADALGISEETVRKHTAAMRAKLRLAKRQELYTWHKRYLDK